MTASTIYRLWVGAAGVAAADNTYRGYDLACYLPGTLPVGVILMKLFGRAVTLPAGLAGSYGACVTAATAETVLSLQKNGVEFATATVAADGTAVSFAAAAEIAFAAGDQLTVVAPDPADDTLAGLSLTLVGSRGEG